MSKGNLQVISIAVYPNQYGGGGSPTLFIAKAKTTLNCKFITKMGFQQFIFIPISFIHLMHVMYMNE